MRRRTMLLPTLALALTLLALPAISGCSLPYKHLFQAPQTIAQNGGVRLTLAISCPATDAHCTVAAQMQNEIAIILQRAQNGLGITDASVTQLDATHLQVNLPGTHDTQQAVSVLAKSGVVNFLDSSANLPIGSTVQPGQYPVVFTGAQIDPNSVTAAIDPQTRQPVVTFAFAGSEKQAFADYTGRHIGQPLTIALDDVIIESATIQSQIDGQAQITGIGSQAGAQALAAYLKSRPLPLPVTVMSETYIQPSH